jgi:DNA-binding MarR family transcriptional regulator
VAQLTSGHKFDDEPKLSLDELELFARIASLAARVATRIRREGRAGESVAGDANHRPDFRLAAKHFYLMRRERSRFFKQYMFGEPAWDMLLLLYSWDEARRPLRAKDLALGAGVASTTALRWQERMVREGWIERRPHPIDHRVIEVHLTASARTQLEQFFERLDLSELCGYAVLPWGD